jgi:hypothetical protein
VNHVEPAQLDALLDVRAANALVAHRPFGSVTAMGPMTYVGTAALGALRKAAHAFWTTMHAPAPSPAPPDPTCAANFDAAVRPHLADVLFLSESDRPLDIVSFPGAGASAPTAASVLALAKEKPGSTAEVRDPADFWVDLEAANATADANAPSAIQAAFAAQLTDVKYVAIFLPKTDPYHAEVRVYLVGRTSCGDLVGLRSISVET